MQVTVAGGSSFDSGECVFHHFREGSQARSRPRANVAIANDGPGHPVSGRSRGAHLVGHVTDVQDGLRAIVVVMVHVASFAPRNPLIDRVASRFQ